MAGMIGVPTSATLKYIMMTKRLSC